jgi:hypothetical protein
MSQKNSVYAYCYCIEEYEGVKLEEPVLSVSEDAYSEIWVDEADVMITQHTDPATYKGVRIGFELELNEQGKLVIVEQSRHEIGRD